MPYQLELHHGIPVINVCQQAKPIPAGATIPDWMEAEHLDGAIWLTKPKTAKGVRTVPIPQGLWNRLWAHIVKWGVPSHGLVFTNLYGHPIRRDNEEKRWRRALKMAGLPYVDIYSARHWLATELAPPARATRSALPSWATPTSTPPACTRIEGTAARQDARRRPARPPRRPVTDGDGFSATRKSIDTPRARR